MSVYKTGQWKKAARILATGPVNLRMAMDRAVMQEAQFFRKKVVEGFRTQAPGGKKFKPLADNTLIARRFAGFKGSKALNVTGSLRNSITVQKKRTVNGVEAFIGVLRTARGKDGKSLVNIAEVHEFGSKPIVIKVTPAMRRFLMAMFSQHAKSGRDAKGRFLKKGQKAQSGGKGGISRGFIITQIPARPFIQPVADAFFKGPIAAARFQGRVRMLLRDFG